MYPLFVLCPQRAPLLVDGSFQSLEALPVEHLQIVFVASSSCSEDDTPAAAPTEPQRRPSAKKRSGFANSNVCPAQPEVRDVRAKTRAAKTGVTKKPSKSKERTKKTERDREEGVEEEEVLDAPANGWPLRRVISIEEDHLPHLLQGGPQPFRRQLSEEKVMSEDTAASEKTHLTHMSPRGRPVGKETPQVNDQL